MREPEDKPRKAPADTRPPGQAAGRGGDREARLAAALRANLRRRKAAGREPASEDDA